MLKKVLIVIGVIAFIAVIGVAGFFIYLKSSFNQIKMQYDNEVISEYKRPLDFSAFNQDLEKLTDDDLAKLSNLIIEKDIASIQANVLKRELTCTDILLFYVKRIKDNDINYNTIIQLNQHALEQAKALDKRIANDEKIGSLFSTILLIKDNISDMDMNTSAGAYVLKDLTTDRDSFIVDTLKKDDAIILGKANLSEWSNYLSTPSSNGFSTLGGQTKNAYGKFDVGGSSSGSSASVALNFCTLSLGTETSGSLIYPASQNSVIALKPTMGLLSRDLIIPISEAQDTAGIIGKSVRDVSTTFKSMLSADSNDPASINAVQFNTTQLHNELDKDYLKGKKLGFVNSNSYPIDKLKKELIALGATIEEININSTDVDIDMGSVLNYGIVHDLESYLNNPAVKSNVKSLKDIVSYNQQEPDKRIPYGQSLHELAIDFDLNKRDYDNIVNHNREVTKELLDRYLVKEDYDAIVSFSNELSALYATATYPALTVPAGYTEGGEPYGVTFVGSLNQDYKLLQIGFAYEQGTRHRKEPNLIK